MSKRSCWGVMMCALQLRRSLSAWLFAVCLLLALGVVAGCRSRQASATVATGATSLAASGTAPEASRLALGLLALEDSDHPVTADQASKLLPLFEMLRSLSQSQTSAQAEIDAVAKEISQVLTPQQRQIIEGQQLSGERLREFFEKLGLPTPAVRGTPRAMQGTPAAPGGFGQAPFAFGEGGAAGGRPGSPFPGGGPESLSPEQLQALRATRQARGAAGFGGRLNPAILQVVIEFLRKRAAS
jgi:hypothetical protein